MGFRGEPKGAPKGREPCAVAWRFQKAHHTSFWRLSFGIHIGDHGPPFLGHSLVQGRLHNLPKERSHDGPRLVRLGGDKGHGVRIVRTIGRVGVHKHIGVHSMEQIHKNLGVSAVHFDKVTVQIKVGRIPTKPVALWPVLVRPRATISSRGPAHIVLRNEHPVGSIQGVLRTIGERQPILDQRKRSIDPTRLTRMDGIVHEHGDFATALCLQTILHGMGAFLVPRSIFLCEKHKCMDGPADVTFSQTMQRHPMVLVRQSLGHGNRFLPSGRAVRILQQLGRPILIRTVVGRLTSQAKDHQNQQHNLSPSRSEQRVAKGSCLHDHK